MNQIIIRGEVIQVPGKWHELSHSQFVHIAYILHEVTNINYARLLLIITIVQPRRYLWLCWHLLFRVNQKERENLISEWLLLIEFLFDKAPEIKINPIKKVRVWHKCRLSTLYGPPDIGNKMTFMELIKADTYYLLYRQSYANLPKRIEALNKLVAVLYREKQKIYEPTKWNGDFRHAYNDAIVDYYVPMVAKMPLAKKYAIVMWYDSIRRKRAARFPSVFPEGEGSGSGKGGNWIDALRQMAGGALNMEQMAGVDADVALYDLNKTLEESRKKRK